MAENFAFALPILGASIVAILVGLTPSYVVFYLHKPNPQPFIEQNPGLGGLRKVMLSGYGFDALYLVVFVNSIAKISGAVRRIQTGILAKNLWPMLAVLVILAFWVVLNL